MRSLNLVDWRSQARHKRMQRIAILLALFLLMFWFFLVVQAIEINTKIVTAKQQQHNRQTQLRVRQRQYEKLMQYQQQLQQLQQTKQATWSNLGEKQKMWRTLHSVLAHWPTSARLTELAIQPTHLSLNAKLLSDTAHAQLLTWVGQLPNFHELTLNQKKRSAEKKEDGEMLMLQVRIK